MVRLSTPHASDADDDDPASQPLLIDDINNIHYTSSPSHVQNRVGVSQMFDNMDTDDEHSWLVGLNRRNGMSIRLGSLRSACTRCFASIFCLFGVCRREHVYRDRTLPLHSITDEYRRQFPANSDINYQQDQGSDFLGVDVVLGASDLMGPGAPRGETVLFEQFQYFLNFYFLIMALSQFVPAIRIGYISTYWGPLGFVLGVTMIREAVDDFYRYRRDREMNSTKYEKLVKGGTVVKIPSSNIKVGDLLVIHKDQRVPADVILMRTTEKQGACFLRTDQLDGETDWKMRLAVPPTQRLEKDADLFEQNAELYIEKPQCDIHAFLGTFKHINPDGVDTQPLNIENTMWADTVLASGTAIGFVIYTGRETRSVMNAATPHSKFGQLDWEINNLTKVLFCFVVALSFAMVCMKGFDGPWYRFFFRFMLLFSYIIPISLRVNLDMAKVTYSWLIGRDPNLPGTVVRSSTIPEELGRISFLLSDKTGTLTKNEMIFKKLHLGTVCFGADSFDEIRSHLSSAFTTSTEGGASAAPSHSRSTSSASVSARLAQAVEAIALCHNVTPLYEDGSDGDGSYDNDGTESDIQQKQQISYQAASPDEVALVSWSELVGLTLVNRDLHTITLRTPQGDQRRYQILQTFPFTSESKRMGIVLKDETTGVITFFMKGADVVMTRLVQYNDWLDEECANMAREGLRTLVVAKRVLTEQQYAEFDKQYHAAKVSVKDRSGNMATALARLEQNMTLLALTGVEDALQDEVRSSLESLKNAGIKVWMLTGDKQETALCIAKSSGLFSRTENVHVFGQVLNRLEAHTELNALKRKQDVALVITGQSLKVCLQHYEGELAELACHCTSVVCCRCSPEQKAQLVHLLRKYRHPLRVAAVGDGGNDVSMIQAAHAGIGIEAKEGRQASLAADFSITAFSHLCRLMLVHGRYCYKRSCSLAQFVMQRGLIISVMQAIFSFMFYFASVSLYQGILMVAYSTIYTCLPVFSLVLDKDVKESVALNFPELYKELSKGRSLTLKTFFIWLLISMYQGAVIMYGALLLFDADFIHVVSITFTALIFTELILLGLTIHTWHWLMIVSELLSVAMYCVSLFFLHNYFDLEYMMTTNFLWKTALITAVGCLPLYIAKCLRQKMAPPSYAKVN